MARYVGSIFFELTGYFLAVAYSYIFYFDYQVDLKVPVVVRLEGTNVDQGKRILKVRI